MNEKGRCSSQRSQPARESIKAMTTTVDRQMARKLHKYFRKFEAANWFYKGALSIGLQSYQLEDMHRNADIWTPIELTFFFASNPEGETSLYKWTYRRVDQLKNLYVWKK